MNELSIALRTELLRVLDESEMTPNEISNYNMSRKAATGIFTIIMYKNTKAAKGQKCTATLELDSEVSTLVVAIGVLDEMIKEASNRHFLSKVQTKTKTKEKTIPGGF